MQKIERGLLGNIQQRFSQLRDELLAASNEFAKSENRDWEQAERLFAASKRVDELCRNVLRPLGDEKTEQSAV